MPSNYSIEQTASSIAEATNDIQWLFMFAPKQISTPHVKSSAMKPFSKIWVLKRWSYTEGGIV